MEVSNITQEVLTIKEFAAKFRSKNEVYQFLTVDVKAYLPKKDNVTMYYLKDICTGKKKCKYEGYLIHYHSILEDL